MNPRQWRRLRRRSLTAAHAAIGALGAAGQRLAERLAYRPREVVVVALLAAGVFGGLAVERWRSRHPLLAEQLEAEPPRPATATPAPFGSRPRSRSALARCEQPGPREATGERAAPRLDLNRATPGELARVPGISWRLAARIVAARDAFEGSAGSGASLDETQPTAGVAPASAVPAGDPPAPVPDPESP
jgi:DNA uptake protein ComE-like DNA-binding protein